MSTTVTPVSLAEYLDTSYSPDREYVDGEIMERYLGQRPHSLLQSNIVFFIRQRDPSLWVWPEQRVRTTKSRVRIPDVCVTLDDPRSNVFDAPPFICIEILSPDDEMSRVLEKLEEYAAFGVPNIWVADPRRKKAYAYSNRKLEEVRDPALATLEPAVTLPLEDIFRNL